MLSFVALLESETNMLNGIYQCSLFWILRPVIKVITSKEYKMQKKKQQQTMQMCLRWHKNEIMLGVGVKVGPTDD